MPKVHDTAWSCNDIDRFILARLERAGLRPSPEADKPTLLRRLSLDLIGLPPTIAELEAYLADSSPLAYTKQVERLLQSPHYGERWGRHWLDAARYADSNGYEKDPPRFIWFYRDWVVSAFNRDLPYDRFLIEQLAGDQLPGATQDQIVATGFLRNSMINEEGGVDPEQFRMEALFDRMDAIGKAILGLTIQCAQCHDHKYDPITQQDYYRMFAFLNNDNEPARVVYTAAEEQQRGEILRQTREIEMRLREATPDWTTRLAAWEQSARQGQPEWIVVRPSAEDISTGGQKYLPQPDGSFLCQGYAPTKHRVKLVVRSDAPRVGGLRLELLNDANLPAYGPGRSFKGTCALTEISVEAAPADQLEKSTPVKIARATADYEQAETPLEANFDDRSGRQRVVGPVRFAIDGKDETAWGIDAGPGRRNVDRNAVFAFEQPIANPGGTILTIYLTQNHGGWNSDDLMTNNLGRFRLSITGAEVPLADPLPLRVLELLATPTERRSEQQIATLFDYWRTAVPEWKAENARIEQLWAGHPEGRTTLVLETRSTLRDTRVLKRGDFLQPTTPVAAGVPGALHALPPPADGSRLSFARWIADRRSPTTARVFVNRVWQAYFGSGIVASSEDFGTQCDPPSHPELLDWLTCEFMDRGWSIKELHRLIVGSATYRQSSRVPPELFARDPYNRLLARGPRVRVEAEIIRDITLATSGLLNRTIGGRPVMPPAPEFLFKPPASYAPFPWVEDTGPERYRRALYTLRRRSTPFPMLSLFDAPNGETACVRRVRSNTPLQALTALNEPLFVEAAQAFARRILREGGSTDHQRLNFAFRCCLSRPPHHTEVAELIGLLDKQRRRIADGWVNPWLLAGGKSEPPVELPAGATPAQLAAYTVVARVMLNLDEVITKQ